MDNSTCVTFSNITIITVIIEYLLIIYLQIFIINYDIL